MWPNIGSGFEGSFDGIIDRLFILNQRIGISLNDDPQGLHHKWVNEDKQVY